MWAVRRSGRRRAAACRRYLAFEASARLLPFSDSAAAARCCTRSLVGEAHDRRCFCRLVRSSACAHAPGSTAARGGLRCLPRALADAGADDAAALRNWHRVVYDRKEAERTADPEPFAVREMFEVRTCPVDLQDDAARTQKPGAPREGSLRAPPERMLFLWRRRRRTDAVRDIAAAILHEGALRSSTAPTAKTVGRYARASAACGVSRDAVCRLSSDERMQCR
ncbi:MAG: hypothetical protein ACLT98_07285 [Eggerthellaceae bacterium]